MLKDMAVVDVSLRRGYSARQFVFGADDSEVTGVGPDSVLEPPLRRVWRQHRSCGEWGRVDPAGDTVRASIGPLIGSYVEGGPPDHLKSNQVRVHGVGVCGQ